MMYIVYGCTVYSSLHENSVKIQYEPLASFLLGIKISLMIQKCSIMAKFMVPYYALFIYAYAPYACSDSGVGLSAIRWSFFAL